MKSFFEFTDYDGTRNSYNKSYIKYVRRSAPVWNTKLSKCCTNVNNLKRHLDNETFLLDNKFYYDQY